MKPGSARVIGVVVTYHPDVELLRTVLDAARPQVAGLVVVDNTPAAAGGPDAAASPDVEVLSMGRNLGLAAALNRGCERAWARDADFVLLFDQDSVPAPDLVERLAKAWSGAEAAGLRVGAAGPRFIDERGSRVFAFVRLGYLRNREAVAQPGADFVATDTLITSGCLIARAALAQAGGMDESLFIDNVDIEWSFRARSHGWALVGAPQAVLHHRIGDDHVPAPWWARLLGKDWVIRHGPPRLYYITRNRIRLYRMRHVPLPWKTQDMLRLPWKLVLSLCVAEGERRAVARSLARGVWDGLANRGGVMPGSAAAPGQPG